MTSRSSTSSPWKEPENLGPIVNGPGPDMVPSISPDGLTLFFEKGDPLPDIWVTSRADVDSDWGEPLNLGPTINTSNAETAAQLSADGSTLYFSRWNSLSGFDELSVELMPFERASLQVGLDPYEENFDDALVQMVPQQGLSSQPAGPKAKTVSYWKTPPPRLFRWVQVLGPVSITRGQKARWIAHWRVV